jgi:4-amino-4-deoxy-L-arabinose transferase-like glycosyltransferase
MTASSFGSSSDPPEPAEGGLSLGDGLAALLLLAFALMRVWPGIGHPSIISWDESAHQAVTRGIYDTGLPVIFAEPLQPVEDSGWIHAHVFLHKPPLPFALGAMVMRVIGVTPLALRSVSFAATLLAALVLYLLGRRMLGRPLAFAMALSFVALPFGFRLLQGYQFGDVTDCTLLAFLALSMWWIARAVERGSIGLAIVAGVACGAAYLSKSVLALTPFGVLGALALLGILGFARRVRLALLPAFAVSAVIVAAPWNIYSALRWPSLYRYESGETWRFMTGRPDAFAIPAIDAVFNKINEQELEPWSVALLLLAGLWAVWAAFRRRDTRLWVVVLWLWGAWVPLSLAQVKAPAHTWGVAPALLLAVGLLLRDSLVSTPLAGAVLGSLSAPFLLPLLPALSRVRGWFPAVLAQTRERPGLAEGLLLALLGLCLGIVVARLPHPRWLVRLFGVAALGGALWVGLVQSGEVLAKMQAGYRDLRVESYTDVLGRALDGAIPEQSVLLWGLDHDPGQGPCCFENLSLMFYSGRMVYSPRLEKLAREKGFHPYLISSAAQPYERVAAVPGKAWLQAYDLDAPRMAPAALPADVVAVNIPAGHATLLGLAVDLDGQDADRYSFYVHSDEPTAPLRLRFQSRGPPGKPDVEQVVNLGPGRNLLSPSHLSSASWYILTSPGPPREDLRAMWLEDQALPLP